VVDDPTKQSYREAWEAWIKQVESLHAALLDGQLSEPAKLKGLLNREARAKEAYDAARLRLLGIEETPTAPPDSDENPFR
jgi:hypothetical protein